MEITIVRKPNTVVTPGGLFIDGKNTGIVTLELKTPLKSETHFKGFHCVPTGKYKILPRFEGAVFGWMKDKVPAVARYGIPHIMNIEGIEYQKWIDRDGIHVDQFVLIHIGNCAIPPHSDTEGCLLVGTEFNGYNIVRSTEAFADLYPMIIEAMTEKNLFIEYVNEV